MVGEKGGPAGLAGVGAGLLEVGWVARAHGLKGEVIVELVTDRAERLAPGSVLTLAPAPRAAGSDVSSPRTLEVRHASRMGGPPASGRAVRARWIVSFAGVVDRNAAEALRSGVLLAPPMEDPEAVWVHEVIGAEVFDIHGTRLGQVIEIEANPASDLLVLDGGGLIPMCFLVEAPVNEARVNAVVVDIPDGLLDP